MFSLHVQDAGSCADYTHLSPKNLCLGAHSGKIIPASGLSGKSLFVLLHIRERKEENGASITLQLGSLRCLTWRGGNKPSIQHCNESSLLHRKADTLSVHLDDVAANIANALIALTHIWGGKAHRGESGVNKVTWVRNKETSRR